jgi:hypothetical protein
MSSTSGRFGFSEWKILNACFEVSLPSFLEMDGNEENVKRDSSRAFVFIAVFSFCAKSEGAAVYRGLVARISS